MLTKDGKYVSVHYRKKLRNIRNNPRVTLALDETNRGHDVVIVEGTAQLIDDPQISVKLPAYVEKYAALIQSMGWTPESMAADYSQAIRVTPTKITVHVVPSRRLSSGLQTEPVLTQFFSRRCKKGLSNICQWTEMPRGAHFAAMEEPELLAGDIVTFFATRHE
jgi:hypothetical protein